MPDTKNIPIRYGKYINHEMEEEKVIFIGAEKAIYGADGRRLDEKLIDMEDSLSDAFSTEKDYAAGDYCVYANRVFKFTNAKAAGAWDGAAVIPVSLAQEIRANAQDIAAINGSFAIEGTASKFLVGGSAQAGIYLRKYESNGSDYQLTASNSGFDFGKHENGTWTSLWNVATKSDLSPFGSLHVKALPEGGVTQNAIISGPNYCAYLIFGQKGILTIVNGVDNGIEISHAGNKPDNFEVSAVDRQRISVKIPAYTNTYVVAMSDFAIENA